MWNGTPVEAIERNSINFLIFCNGPGYDVWKSDSRPGTASLKGCLFGFCRTINQFTRTVTERHSVIAYYLKKAMGKFKGGRISEKVNVLILMDFKFQFAH